MRVCSRSNVHVQRAITCPRRGQWITIDTSCHYRSLGVFTVEALATRTREGGEQMALYRNPNSEWYKRALEGGMTKEQIAANAKQVQDDLNVCKTERKQLEEQVKPILEEFDRLMLLMPQPPSRARLYQPTPCSTSSSFATTPKPFAR